MDNGAVGICHRPLVAPTGSIRVAFTQYYESMRPFSRKEEKLIIQAIQNAECMTSGEVRVHVEGKCPESEVLDRAVHVFDSLGMQNTQLRNGVLIYVAIASKQFAIIGDEGINKVVPEGFWNGAVEAMRPYFAKGKVAQAIAQGIQMVGELLKEKFPYQSDDKNELSDEISYGK